MTLDWMRIGQLAKMLGTTTKTIRFYERIGLLKAAVRSDSGYRYYDNAAVGQARLVIGLRRLDLSIQELKDLLRDDSRIAPRQRLLALMDEKLRATYLQLGVLQGRCDDLTARHAALLSTPRDRPPECICDALFRPCGCGKQPTTNPIKKPPARRSAVKRK